MRVSAPRESRSQVTSTVPRTPGYRPRSPRPRPHQQHDLELRAVLGGGCGDTAVRTPTAQPRCVFRAQRARRRTPRSLGADARRRHGRQDTDAVNFVGDLQSAQDGTGVGHRSQPGVPVRRAKPGHFQHPDTTGTQKQHPSQVHDQGLALRWSSAPATQACSPRLEHRSMSPTTETVTSPHGPSAAPQKSLRSTDAAVVTRLARVGWQRLRL